MAEWVDGIFVDKHGLVIKDVSVVDANLSGYKSKRWTVVESRFERCRFENVRVDYFCFGAGKVMSEYIDCSFDGSRIRALGPGRARFVRCSFRDVRLTKWICKDAEFIDCVFTGVLREINFNAELYGQDIGRDRNRYEGNDFSGATLINVAFMGGVDLFDQKLPQGDGYVFLEHAEPVVIAALDQAASWSESEEGDDVRASLETALDYVRGGQRQLLMSGHAFTDRDGTKERAWARLSGLLRTILARQDAEDPTVESVGAMALRVTRRAVRGHEFVYFRAADAVSAMSVVHRDGGPLSTDGGEGLDGVQARGIEPFRTLGTLVALAQNTHWTLDTVPFVFVWPPAADEPTSLEEYENLPVDSPWKNPPATLQELGIPVRDTLASITDDQLPDLATHWAHSEELSQYSDSTPATIRPLATALVELARQARDTNQMLYTWSSR
ncbi:hypothetical protein [Actinophytocola sediminis]